MNVSNVFSTLFSVRTLLGCSRGRMEEMDGVPCNTVPLAEHVRMKAQFQECIDLLKTENSAHCDKIVQLEKLRIKVKQIMLHEQICM